MQDADIFLPYSRPSFSAAGYQGFLDSFFSVETLCHLFQTEQYTFAQLLITPPHLLCMKTNCNSNFQNFSLLQCSEGSNTFI